MLDKTRKTCPPFLLDKVVEEYEDIRQKVLLKYSPRIEPGARILKVLRLDNIYTKGFTSL